jgi:NAD(P)-dependent dehydrogenase (short-subunit alcohol dehydrogenase family)
MPTAIITGASRGLGLELARALAADGWRLVVDARGADALRDAAAAIGGDVTVLPGDVGHRAHRRELVHAAGERIDLLVNNASVLGPSPQPPLAAYRLDVFAHVYAVNVFAPLELMQLARPALPDGAIVLNVTSDAAVEAYEGWGGYGSSKAALEQLTAVFAAEEPGLRVYAVDPGDMDTQLHREAEPGEDLSHLPKPAAVVPGLLELIGHPAQHPSGRYRAHDLIGAAA